MCFFKKILNFLLLPKKPDPIPGEHYMLFENESNPFRNKNGPMVEIIDIKNGWVKYRFFGISLFQNESMKIDIFHSCYKKIGEQ